MSYYSLERVDNVYTIQHEVSVAPPGVVKRHKTNTMICFTIRHRGEWTRWRQWCTYGTHCKIEQYKGKLFQNTVDVCFWFSYEYELLFYEVLFYGLHIRGSGRKYGNVLSKFSRGGAGVTLKCNGISGMLGFLLKGLIVFWTDVLFFRVRPESAQRSHAYCTSNICAHHIRSKTIFLQQSSLRKGEYYYSGRQHRVQRGSIGTWGGECGCAFCNNLELHHK